MGGNMERRVTWGEGHPTALDDACQDRHYLL